jgi:hypothetical protein
LALFGAVDEDEAAPSAEEGGGEESRSEKTAFGSLSLLACGPKFDDASTDGRCILLFQNNLLACPTIGRNREFESHKF